MSSAEPSILLFSIGNITTLRDLQITQTIKNKESLEESDRQDPSQIQEMVQKFRKESPLRKVCQNTCLSRSLFDNTNSNEEPSKREDQILPTFCVKCRYIFDHWYEVSSEFEGKEFPFYSNTSFMKSSAKDGCLLCSQFVGILESRSLLQDSGINQAISSLLVTPRSTCYWKICLRQEKIEWEILAFFENTKADGPPAGISHEKKGRDAIPLVKRWLYNCCTVHDRCSMLEERFLPKRLIFIGDSLPRLMQTTGIKGYPKYATLSHCWGKLKSLTLYTNNLETFTTRIPPEALPQSFEDAIEVAQSLDIDYLWIDSLCIIQDKDSDDWIKEAAQMSNVYGYSYLNIAATSAVDGSKGFLHNEYNCNSGFRTRANIGDGEVFCVCVPKTLYGDSISSSPLAQRGWVVQERLLAPRTVHFTSRQVFWECNSSVGCETFPMGLPDSFEFPGGSDVYLRKKPLLEYSWKEIVEQYSRGSLTRSHDKLVAISGVARAAQHTQRIGYLAGLWRSSLIFQLCWNCTGAIAPPPVEYRGPSWSWISVDSSVTLVSGPHNTDTTKSTTLYAQVVDAHVGLAGPDAFGEVSSASLHLNCKILYPINVSAELPHSSGSLRIKIWGINIRARICFDSPGGGKGPLYLFPIMSRVVQKLDFLIRYPVNGEVEGLLLKPIDISPGHYKRVGKFELDCGEYTESDQRLFFAAMLKAKPLSSSHYSKIQQEANGTMKYIITLI